MKNLISMSALLLIVAACGVGRAPEVDTARLESAEVTGADGLYLYCQSRGKTFFISGDGVEAEANLTMLYYPSRDAARSRLTDIKGEIALDPNKKTYSRAYRARFDIAELKANPKYRPTRYEGSSQFKEFDAIQPAFGADDDWMEWVYGTFILAAKPSEKGNYDAHYILYAGDHVGGTLHMTCKIAQRTNRR